MLGNYLKVALRSLTRHRLYTFLNLLGLTTGLTCAVLVAFYLVDELTYDAFHPGADRIFRVVERAPAETGDKQIGIVSFNVSEAARQQIPEVVNAVKLTSMGRMVLRNEENQRASYEEWLAAEPSFLEIFNFPLLTGDRHRALAEPNRIILTRDLAEILFGESDPMGKVLTTDRGLELTVSGVLAPIPANSHLDFNSLVSFATFHSQPWFERVASTDWNSNLWLTYVKLKEGADANTVAGKLSAIIAQRQPADHQPYRSTFVLQPLQDIHFHSKEIESDRNTGKSSIGYVYFFGVTGLFVLLIACVNYMNLITARSQNYSKEIGVRKVVGATRRHLQGRFLAESLLLCLAALVLALNLVHFLLPAFNNFTGKDLSLSLDNQGVALLWVLVGLLLLTALAAGSYPAWYLSRFHPVRVLKGRSAESAEGFNLRRGLVVFQFILSTVMITCTLIAYRQLQYVNRADLGFNHDQLVVVDINSRRVRDGFATIKEGYEQLGSVRNVTVSSRIPGEWKVLPKVLLQSEGQTGKEGLDAFFIGADEEFLNTFDIELVQGAAFTGDPQMDSSALLINEQAALALGIDRPAGQELLIPSIAFEGNERILDEAFRGRVVGIVKDFHYQSLYEPMRPMIIAYRNNPIHSIDYFTVRIDGRETERTIAGLTAILQDVDPDHLFEYHFLDDQLRLFYETDNRRSALLGVAAAIAIFIACLGLFGLATFLAEQRTKEIGIRKVLGASVINIVALLSREFLLLVGLALLLAAPLAWYGASRWLSGFAYHVQLAPWMFIVPGLAATLIALLTVSYQAIRAALNNPVDSLRRE